MAQLFAVNSSFGIDQSTQSTGSQFLVANPSETGQFDSNTFHYLTGFSNGAGHGWYEGSGFQTQFVSGARIPTGGTVNTIKVDFSGGNTQDVSIGLISVSLVSLYNADWATFQNLVFAGDDRLIGSYHGDKLAGQSGHDIMFGGYGDKLNPFDPNGPNPNPGTFNVGFTVAPVNFVDDGADVLDGGAGHDSMDGGTNNDTLYGGTENDLMYGGGSGNDVMFGGTGNDTIHGGSGRDKITGDKGRDRLTGGRCL